MLESMLGTTLLYTLQTPPSELLQRHSQASIIHPVDMKYAEWPDSSQYDAPGQGGRGHHTVYFIFPHRIVKKSDS